jgi:hypothetical protein
MQKYIGLWSYSKKKMQGQKKNGNFYALINRRSIRMGAISSNLEEHAPG